MATGDLRQYRAGESLETGELVRLGADGKIYRAGSQWVVNCLPEDAGLMREAFEARGLHPVINPEAPTP